MATRSSSSSASTPSPRTNPLAPSGISLVLPAYNEEAIIEQAIREADEALAEIGGEYEIIVVDDGSRDRTAELARREADRRPRVRVVSQPKNMGYGAALKRGFAEASLELVGFTDADCQFDLRELDRLKLLARDYDIVSGYRIDRQDPWLRLVYSRTYNLMVRTLLNTGVRDCDCALKLFRREVVQEIEIETSGYLVNAEMLAKARLAGHSLVEVGVSHRPRGGGQSKVSVRDVVPVLVSLARFWWNWALFPERGATRTAAPSAASEPQRAPQPAPERGSRLTWLSGALVAVVAAVMLFGHLAYPLIEPDESRYAQIALEMQSSGDYVVPTRFGVPYLDKPPLLYWLTASSYSAFGVNEQAARIPTSAAAWLTVLTVYLLGRHLVGERAALFGSLLLVLSSGFLLAGRFILMDGLLTLFTTLTFLCLFRAAGQETFRPWWWLLASIACGLGVLTKGPVALVLCLPPLLVHRWLTQRPALSWRQWALLLAPVAAISIPWLVAVAERQSEFVGYFFWKHNVVRFVNAFNHREAWWFYVPALLLGLFPASLLLPAHAVATFGRSPTLRVGRTVEAGYCLLAAAWIVGFFSLASCKLPPYILPAFPMLCLGMGRTVESLVSRTPRIDALAYFSRTLPRWISGSMAVTALVLAASLAAGVPFGSSQPVVYVPAAALALAACGAYVATLRTQVGAWRTSGVAAFAVMGMAFLGYYPQVAAHRSVSTEALAHADEVSDPAQPVVYFNREAGFSPFALSGRKVHCLSSGAAETLAQVVRENPETIILTNPTNREEVARAIPPYLELVPLGTRGRVYVTRIRGDGISVAERARGAQAR